jgi:hypothetical protein
MFAAATGLRPEEWGALERRDIDRHGGVLTVRATISSGELVELGKTNRSRRQVPLSTRALGALDEIPPRLDSAFMFAAKRGGPFDLANFRRREWQPAIEASGVRRPARIYDMRSTFASNSLAAGISVFELARVMGTSVVMIERHYGTLIEGAGADIARRLSGLRGRAGCARRAAFGPLAGHKLGALRRSSSHGNRRFAAVTLDAPGRTRTSDPLLRRQPLSPAELRGRSRESSAHRCRRWASRRRRRTRPRRRRQRGSR